MCVKFLGFIIIKEVNKQLKFHKENFKVITPGIYKKYNDQDIHLNRYIGEVKKKLDEWRNGTLYDSIVKPIEDELGIKKGDW